MGTLTSQELKEARTIWERYVQRCSFTPTINNIKNGKNDDLKKQLGIEIDEDGVIRCHGRLSEILANKDTKFPKLLTKQEPFTDLVIKDCHETLFHSGVSHTLSQIRQQYWILQGRRQVQKVIRRCRKCIKAIGKSYSMPKMPSWPIERITASPPFSYTGLDYFGPVYVKNKDVTSKCWVCLFTCLAVRALHLEIVNDLSAEEFLCSLRRFIARRGKPIQIISDNAAQFKLAKTVIERLWLKVMTDPDVQNYISTQGIQWKFIVELAPWMGGFYERLVGSVKQALRKSLSKTSFTTDQFATLITEVEAVINSRPLVYVGDDINSGLALSPAHFLLINPKTGIPVLEEDLDPEYLTTVSNKDAIISRWTTMQTYLNQLWKIWSREYLLVYVKDISCLYENLDILQ